MSANKKKRTTKKKTARKKKIKTSTLTLRLKGETAEQMEKIKRHTLSSTSTGALTKIMFAYPEQVQKIIELEKEVDRLKDILEGYYKASDKITTGLGELAGINKAQSDLFDVEGDLLDYRY